MLTGPEICWLSARWPCCASVLRCWRNSSRSPDFTQGDAEKGKQSLSARRRLRELPRLARRRQTGTQSDGRMRRGGQHSRDPAGRRRAFYDVIRCGVPGTQMPYHDQRSYKDDRCNGLQMSDFGPGQQPVRGKTFSEGQMVDLVAYLEKICDRSRQAQPTRNACSISTPRPTKPVPTSRASDAAPGRRWACAVPMLLMVAGLAGVARQRCGAGCRDRAGLFHLGRQARPARHDDPRQRRRNHRLRHQWRPDFDRAQELFATGRNARPRPRACARSRSPMTTRRTTSPARMELEYRALQRRHLDLCPSRHRLGPRRRQGHRSGHPHRDRRPRQRQPIVASPWC